MSDKVNTTSKVGGGVGFKRAVSPHVDSDNKDDSNEEDEDDNDFGSASRTSRQPKVQFNPAPSALKKPPKSALKNTKKPQEPQLKSLLKTKVADPKFGSNGAQVDSDLYEKHLRREKRRRKMVRNASL
jgi:hypothetical protein